MRNPLALIIEDDHKQADIFSLALQGAEYDVKVVHSGEAALIKLDTVVPTLVLLDLHLPGVSGKTILQRIRADDRLKHTQIMLATADAQFADELRPASDLVLLKPIDVMQLRELARRLRPGNTG